MRSIELQVIKLAIYSGIGLVMLGCGTRKKTVKTDLEASYYNERLTDYKSDRQLVTSFYGDVLKGTFDADTNDLDSGLFESNGIKIKFKAKSKNGRPVIDFTAEAKPVARSALTEKEQATEKQKQTSEAVLKSETELTKRSWPWWYYPLILIAGLAVLVWAFKKLKTWIKHKIWNKE